MQRDLRPNMSVKTVFLKGHDVSYPSEEDVGKKAYGPAADESNNKGDRGHGGTD